MVKKNRKRSPKSVGFKTPRRSIALSALFAVLLAIPILIPDAAFAVPRGDTGSAESSNPQLNKQNLETLLSEAQDLFARDQPIDARSKLLKALQIAPNDYRPHMLLGTYYLSSVAHFRLAHRYLTKAEELFEKQFGTDRDGTLDPTGWRHNAHLLYLLAETRLNLDNYEGSLATLDRFEKRYWDTWYPGTRAWVLMKLKRLDDAIQVAQSGLLRGADPARTYNILGILLSLKGNRTLSLEAFRRAIQSELALGGMGQAATPLNNSGEVYRELFSDDLAEAAWLKAISLPDGCEHILPSLNLAILYADELRLFQAERVLDNFERCFAENSIRSDTEHRSLLALLRGRISLRIGESEKAISYLTEALEREQWFGKIGTNENDLRFAATLGLAEALDAHASVLHDRARSNIIDSVRDDVLSRWLQLRAWWLRRRARQIALEELEDFEDLFVRHTDTMLEYPSLGNMIAGFPTESFVSRLQRVKKEDQRFIAHAYYDTYLATNYRAQGKREDATRLLQQTRLKFREIDRMIKAVADGHLIELLEQKDKSFLSSLSSEEQKNLKELKEQLYLLLPSHFRYSDLALPVQVQLAESERREFLSEIREELLKHRFREVGPSAKFLLAIRDIPSSTPGEYSVNISLRQVETRSAPLAQVTIELKDSSEDIAEIVNAFVDDAFRHKIDPKAAPVPKLELLEGTLRK